MIQLSIPRPLESLGFLYLPLLPLLFVLLLQLKVWLRFWFGVEVRAEVIPWFLPVPENRWVPSRS